MELYGVPETLINDLFWRESLVKLRRARRGGKEFRYLDWLSAKELHYFYQILPAFLVVSDFELVITALYTYKVLGKSEEELRNLIQRAKSPNAEPYQNALLYISTEPVSGSPASLVTDYEPDEIIQPY